MRKILFVGFEPSYFNDVISRFGNIEFRVLVPGTIKKVHSLKDERCYLLNDENAVFDNEAISLIIDKFPLDKIIDSDRVLRSRNREKCENFIKVIASSITTHIDDFKPDLVFSTYDNAHSFVSYYIAQIYNLKWGAFFFTTIPKGYVSISRSIHDVSQLYHCNSNISQDLVESVFESTEGNTETVYMYESSGIKLSMIKKLAVFFDGKVGYHKMLWPTLLEKLKIELGKYRSRKVLGKCSSTSFDIGDNYVIYFLQMTPESTIDVWANPFRQQSYLVKLLRFSLPRKLKLVVKVHPSDPGGLQPHEIRAFKKMGIDIVSNIDSKVLIANALFVATVTGTPALEAYILGKPTLMFGPHPYSRLTGINFFDNSLCSLDAVIQETLNTPLLSREERLDEFKRWLSSFRLGRLNNWRVPSTDDEILRLEELLINYTQ